MTNLAVVNLVEVDLSNNSTGEIPVVTCGVITPRVKFQWSHVELISNAAKKSFQIL